MLRYSKETCWVWTLQLGSASTNSALILWKKDCHSQTHGEKQFGCLGKHFGCWFSLHYCQFLSPAWDFPKETLSLDLLTRSSAHRFIMCSRARPLTMQRSTSWHHYLRGNVQFVKSEFFNFGTLQGNTEKAMATHSSILAWKIPWTEGPGGLPSLGSQRVGHDWSDLAAAEAAAAAARKYAGCELASCGLLCSPCKAQNVSLWSHLQKQFDSHFTTVNF